MLIQIMFLDHYFDFTSDLQVAILVLQAIINFFIYVGAGTLTQKKKPWLARL